MFTKKLKNTFDIKGLKKVTIKGKIGTLTFYGQQMTKTKAQENYNQMEYQMNVFWEANKDTYFVSHPEIIDIVY